MKSYLLWVLSGYCVSMPLVASTDSPPLSPDASTATPSIDLHNRSLQRSNPISAELAEQNAYESQSANPPAVAQLDTILVKGRSVGKVQGEWLNPTDALLSEHPGARQRIGQNEFNASGATSLGDALRKVSGIQAPEHSSTSVSSMNVGVRGLSARLTSKTTVLLDGIPMSVAPYGQPHLSLAPVNLGNIQAVDVIKNGGAVRYGPQNVGGIINFETAEIPEKLTTNIRMKGTQSDASITDAQGEMNFAIGRQSRSGNGMLLSMTRLQGSGYREHSETQVDDAFLKITQSLSPQSMFNAQVHYYWAENELPGGLTQQQYNEDRFQSFRPYDQFSGHRREVALGYENRLDSGALIEIKSWANNSEREFILTNNNTNLNYRMDRYPRDYEVAGFEPRLGYGLASAGLWHEFGIGYRWVSESGHEQRYRRSGVDANSNPYEIDEILNRDNQNFTQAHAVYFDDRIDVGNFSITPGIRYENITISRLNKLTRQRENLHYKTTLPSLNSLYRMDNGINLYANYNTSFTTVTYAQINASEFSDDLKPEKAKIYEIGSRQMTKFGQWEATIFALQFDDILEYVRDTGGYLNRGKTFHRGVEWTSSIQLPAIKAVSINSTYTYTKATFEEGEVKNNHVPFYSSHVANVGVGYQMSRLSLQVDWYGQSRQFSDAENTYSDPESLDSEDAGKLGVIPAFSYVNTRLSISNKLLGLRSELSIGVKNLFDRQYFTRETPATSLESGLYAGLPRTFYLETKASF